MDSINICERRKLGWAHLAACRDARQFDETLFGAISIRLLLQT